jgi:mRNA-degrading endonuclease RelE of RelBE toxin-antitoxin system
MSTRPRYDIEFTSDALSHLDVIERKYYSLIERTVTQQLTHTPDKETRNRKPLEQPVPLGATWELRFGPNNRFRVYYHIDPEERLVTVKGIGVKVGSRLWIGGVEIFL